MSWMKSFFGKSSNIAQKVNGNKFVPSLGGNLKTESYWQQPQVLVPTR